MINISITDETAKSMYSSGKFAIEVSATDEWEPWQIEMFNAIADELGERRYPLLRGLVELKRDELEEA